jgi:hypothetical protein
MSLDVYLSIKSNTLEIERELFSANITHNLNQMASMAGIYYYLWRPEELAATKASDLIVPLTLGLARLRNNPKYYKTLNPENGWGNYEILVEFVSLYLSACKENPDADVSVSR